MTNPKLNPIIVHRGRANQVRVNLGINVSGDTFTSEIRTEPDVSSTLIAAWTVDFATDGEDGTLILSLNAGISAAITYKNGYMDLKRVTGGQPVPVFDEPIPVVIRGTVTQ